MFINCDSSLYDEAQALSTFLVIDREATRDDIQGVPKDQLIYSHKSNDIK